MQVGICGRVVRPETLPASRRRAIRRTPAFRVSGVNPERCGKSGMPGSWIVRNILLILSGRFPFGRTPVRPEASGRTGPEGDRIFRPE